MNKILTTLLLILLLCTFGCGENKQEAAIASPAEREWISLGNTGDDYELFYDRRNIERINDPIIRVWTKQVYNDNGIRQYVEKMTKVDSSFKKFQKLNFRYIEEFLELNCKTRDWRFIARTHYSANKSVIKSEKVGQLNPTEGWLPLDTLQEKIWHAECPFKKP